MVGDDRGSLPFALLHGESLVACAAWALGDVEGVVQVGAGVTDWQVLAESGMPVLLHDLACPMTPAEFLADCVAECARADAVVVGVRPVTDTVKEVADGYVGRTVDREPLRAVCSPLVLPAAVVAALPDWPEVELPELVVALGERWPVRQLEAPAQARRVSSADDLALLEALTSPAVRS